MSIAVRGSLMLHHHYAWFSDLYKNQYFISFTNLACAATDNMINEA